MEMYKMFNVYKEITIIHFIVYSLHITANSMNIFN